MALLRVVQMTRGRAGEGVGDDVCRDRAVALEVSALRAVGASEQGGIGDDDTDVEGRGAAWAGACRGAGRCAAQDGIDQEIGL